MNTNTEFLSYANSQRIEAGGCYAISFIRKTGTNSVSVSGYPLSENESFEIRQNVGDCDMSNYDIVFTDDGAANGSELFIIKIMPIN